MNLPPNLLEMDKVQILGWSRSIYSKVRYKVHIAPGNLRQSAVYIPSIGYVLTAGISGNCIAVSLEIILLLTVIYSAVMYVCFLNAFSDKLCPDAQDFISIHLANTDLAQMLLHELVDSETLKI